MPRQPLRSISFVRPLCVLAALALAPAAQAGEVQTLTMRDGSKVTGQVVETVVGDHVTVELAPGMQLRIQWSSLAPDYRASLEGGGSKGAAESASPPRASPGREEGEARPPEEPDGYEAQPASAGDAGPGRRISLGVETGFPAPLGFLAVVVDAFPFRFPGLRRIGVELSAAVPIENEPPTLGESLLFELPSKSGRVGIGFGAGVAQSFVKGVIPTDHAGVVNTAVFDLTHLTISFIPQLSIRVGWGWAFFINGTYCKPHPEACPELASADDMLSFYGHFTALWTYDFDRSSR